MRAHRVSHAPAPGCLLAFPQEEGHGTWSRWPSPGNLVGFRTLYYNIFYQGKNVARILADEICHEFSTYDFAILKLLGDYVDKMYFQTGGDRFAITSFQKQTLLALLRHENVSDSQIGTFVQSMRLDQTDEQENTYFCIIADSSSNNEKIQTDEIFARQLAVRLSCVCFTVIDERIFFCSVRNSFLIRMISFQNISFR